MLWPQRHKDRKQHEDQPFVYLSVFVPYWLISDDFRLKFKAEKFGSFPVMTYLCNPI
jgi:hypothetical protein